MAKSLQSQINELRRIIEIHHVQHRLLKAKVTHLAARLRTLEPFTYAEDRELFRLYVQEFLDKKKDP
jgi:hypothetical protein